MSRDFRRRVANWADHPVLQSANAGGPGRDVKQAERGVVHGATDDIGSHTVQNRLFVTDIDRTILKVLGLESRQLEVPGRKRLDIDHDAAIDEITA